MPKPLIICLAGPSRSGKDTLARAISRSGSAKSYKVLEARGLARSIWEAVCAVFEDLGGRIEDATKGSPAPGLEALGEAATPREWAIAFGEGARRHFGPDLWVRVWWATVRQELLRPVPQRGRSLAPPRAVIVIPDVRRRDEIQSLFDVVGDAADVVVVGVRRLSPPGEVDKVWDADTYELALTTLDIPHFATAEALTTYMDGLGAVVLHAASAQAPDQTATPALAPAPTEPLGPLRDAVPDETVEGAAGDPKVACADFLLLIGEYVAQRDVTASTNLNEAVATTLRVAARRLNEAAAELADARGARDTLGRALADATDQIEAQETSIRGQAYALGVLHDLYGGSAGAGKRPSEE